MTTTTAGLYQVPPTTALHRIVRVARLHFANPWSTLTLPWIILGIIFIANLGIWLVIAWSLSAGQRGDVADGLQYSGSTFYIFVYMLIVAMQSIGITFPFALGYGVTRRDYYLGTALAFTGLAAIYSVGLTLLGVVERLTNGWGLGGRLFTAFYFGDSWLQNLWVYFVGILFAFFVGSFFASIWVRWKTTGIIFTFVGLGLLVTAVIALLVLTNSWGAIGAFFGNAGLIGSVSLSLIVSALAGLTAFLVLRRATPQG